MVNNASVAHIGICRSKEAAAESRGHLTINITMVLKKLIAQTTYDDSLALHRVHKQALLALICVAVYAGHLIFVA